MVSSEEILSAFRELSNTKQLDRAELYGLLQDGIMAALAKKYGPNVQAEVNIDDGKGDIRIVLLKDVVETVEDPSRQISLEDARVHDEGFEVGDSLDASRRVQRVVERDVAGRRDGDGADREGCARDHPGSGRAAAGENGSAGEQWCPQEAQHECRVHDRDVDVLHRRDKAPVISAREAGHHSSGPRVVGAGLETGGHRGGEEDRRAEGLENFRHEHQPTTGN